MASRSWTTVIPAIAMAITSCGASNRTNDNADAGAPTAKAAIQKVALDSDAFENGKPIPADYTCDGAGRVPALHWSEPPTGTKTFALVVDDPDAPGGTFSHWGVFDIPASERSIGGGRQSGTEVANDFGKPGYGGPCPPPGRGPHHYHFKLFALDTGELGLSPSAKVADVEKAARRNAIAAGELVGTYERK